MCGKKMVVWLMLTLITNLSFTGGFMTNLSVLAQEAVGEAEVVSSDVMTMRPFVRTKLVRVALMKLRRDFRKEGENEKVAAITQVLRNRDALEAVAESICVQFVEEHPQGVPGDWVDRITALIQWIIENADEIIALIMKIIVLFVQNTSVIDGSSICANTCILPVMAA